MKLHISGKLCALGLVIATLITAFSLPYQDGVALAIRPGVALQTTPRAFDTGATTVVGPIANPSFVLKATGYNSLSAQTDSTPHTTATGQRTRFGIVAVSRDLLGADVPYGSLVRIKDLGNFYNGRGRGQFQTLLDTQGLFVVEDTMHPRKRQQVDLWFGDYASAINWGVRQVEVELVRYGRTGPTLTPVEANGFQAVPQLLASR